MKTIYANDKLAETAQNWVNRPYETKMREAVNLTANETEINDEEFFIFAETTPGQDARTAVLKAEGQALSDLRGKVFTDINGTLLHVEIIDEAGFAAAIAE